MLNNSEKIQRPPYGEAEFIEEITDGLSEYLDIYYMVDTLKTEDGRNYYHFNIYDDRLHDKILRAVWHPPYAVDIADMQSEKIKRHTISTFELKQYLLDFIVNYIRITYRRKPIMKENL